MNKKQFISQYICTFLATYMAGRYDDDCMNGHPNEPYNHQPVEDARFLAEKAWEQTYDPYQIGRDLFKNGKGISAIASSVDSDGDLDECLRGYEFEQNRKNYYD